MTSLKPSNVPVGPINFPVGSMIVREKFLQKDDQQPELLAAMVKRAPGFSKRTGDWEYLVLDGDGKKLRERTQKGECYGCHSKQKNQDYVFPLPEVK
ncbi:MAG TPA: cytochrome P460 family protein [Pyrinomonadaceae bacterium]|nr:cytochrome P460 family protein [Pyrinomonadaceae bacterium]